MLFNLYNCKEALQRLNDYMDRELSPEETRRVEVHLKICHSCARKFAFEARVLDEMRIKIQRIPLPDNLLQKVLEALPDDLPPAALEAASNPSSRPE